MHITTRIAFTIISFIILIAFPENLSRSALPHQTDILSPNDEAIIYQYLMRDKVERIDALLNRYKWFNGNVMVVKDRRILYEHSQGFANYNTREPLTTSSVFELASVSKQFTAIAILMLYEQNLLDLDDLVCDFIPELPYKNITIRHLLHHTSGLPNYMWVLENFWNNPDLPSNEDMLQMLVEQHPYPFFWAGRRYNYSNTGYAVLASVVERITGQSFTQYMHENIFEPLGMRNTYTSVEVLDSARFIQHRAVGHHQAWRRMRQNTTVVHDMVLGDKGIHSNLEDLYKWDQALYNGVLVSEETLQMAFTPGRVNRRHTVPYGFGFRLEKRNGREVVYHHGLWEGFQTSFIRYIETGDAVIILNNANQRINNEIIRQIEKVINQPFEPNPTQQLALIALNEGLLPAIKQYEKMKQTTNLEIDYDELLNITRLLIDINKPLLSSRLYNFYQACLPYEEAIAVAVIE